jgi:hypothetical protein
MKIAPNTFKGIEYLNISQIPCDDIMGILDIFGEEVFIKILIDGRIQSRCIQYKDYEFWYELTIQSGKYTDI